MLSRTESGLKHFMYDYSESNSSNTSRNEDLVEDGRAMNRGDQEDEFFVTGKFYFYVTST